MRIDTVSLLFYHLVILCPSDMPMSSASSSPRTSALPPRIGIFLIPTDPFWIQVREAILYTNQSFGDDLIVLQPAISNQALDSIPSDQVLDLVLAQELDALICATGSMALIEALIKEKLPVVCLDEMDLRHPGLSVASSLYPGGKIAGEYIAHKLNGKGHSICISAGQEKTITLGQSRFAGFRDALAPYSDITIGHIPVFWRYDEAYPALLAALENYPCPINAIFGVSDTVILAARDAGRKLGIINHETVLVGLNGDPLALAAVAEGSLSATVDTAAAGLGSRAMQIAHQAAMGLPQPPIVEHQFHLITRENVASVATQKLIEIANLPTQMVGYSRQKENERLSQLEISIEITRQIGSLRERDRVADIVAKSVRQHYGYEWVRILRWSEQDRTLVHFGGDLSPASQRVPIDQDRLVQDAFHSNQVVFIQDMHTSHRWHIEKEFELIRSRAVLPIQLGSQVIGVLDLQSARPQRQPSFETVGLKLLASQMGIVIQNFELYQEALLAREAAENANQLKTRLLANVGHEMRTPLNSILGFSQAIQKQLESGDSIRAQDLRGELEHISNSSEHLMYMINDLLDLSRAEIGALSLYFEPLQPTRFLEQVFHDFAPHSTETGSVEWQLDVPNRLPLIRADVVRLRQILTNLLVNARKFTLAGSITLGAAVEAPYLHLWVRDTGQGIPIQVQEKIFEPFGTAGRTRRAEGIGLGLSITRHLVALHGGTITLESQPGVGSTFNIYLPLPGVSQDAQVKPTGDSANIMLVISTESRIPEEIQEICERQHLTLLAVATHQDLEQALAQGRPHAIAWDLEHAHAHEWNLIHRINANPECAALPFLLFNTGEHKGQLDRGLTEIVFKPVPSNILQDWITQLGADAANNNSILIVDDDPECRSYYARLLKSSAARHNLILAEGGNEAIEILKQETPALVLLDLMMPDVDGFAVLEWVRGNARTRSVPVIIISGKLLNYEDVQRLNHSKTILATKGILTETETADLLTDLAEEPTLLAQSTSTLIRQAVSFVQQNYAQPINRKEIAAAVGVNPNYLSQIFHQEMSISLVDYLNRYRIQRAQELLVQSSDTITKIATLVGYDDAAYFSRVFHRLTGKSPQEFRQAPQVHNSPPPNS